MQVSPEKSARLYSQSSPSSIPQTPHSSPRSRQNSVVQKLFSAHSEEEAIHREESEEKKLRKKFKIFSIEPCCVEEVEIKDLFTIQELKTNRNEKAYALCETALELIFSKDIESVLKDFMERKSFYAEANSELTTQSGLIICKGGDTLFHVFSRIYQTFRSLIATSKNEQQKQRLRKKLEQFKEQSFKFLSQWNHKQRKHIVLQYQNHQNSDHQTFAELNNMALLPIFSLVSMHPENSISSTPYVCSKLLNLFANDPMYFGYLCIHHTQEIIDFQFMDDTADPIIPTKMGDTIASVIARAINKGSTVSNHVVNLKKIFTLLKDTPGFEYWILQSLLSKEHSCLNTSTQSTTQSSHEKKSNMSLGDLICQHVEPTLLSSRVREFADYQAPKKYDLPYGHLAKGDSIFQYAQNILQNPNNPEDLKKRVLENIRTLHEAMKKSKIEYRCLGLINDLVEKNTPIRSLRSRGGIRLTRQGSLPLLQTRKRKREEDEEPMTRKTKVKPATLEENHLP